MSTWSRKIQNNKKVETFKDTAFQFKRQDIVCIAGYFIKRNCDLPE